MIAVYVHFPFCLSICPYCDFDRQATGFDRIDPYLDAVVDELATYRCTPEPVHSIFFGGGTPSLMRADQVVRLVGAIRTHLCVDTEAEITLEANPGDADLEKLRAFRAAGVNRLSYGVQSLDDAYLELLGRRHSADAARRAARWAREAGFFFNLDLMYGLPKQTPEHWAATLNEALALRPDHLSCYLLTLDEKVAMGRDVARGKLTLPEDDDVCSMYEHARVRLRSSGYEQYEISNWARPGQASRHNLTYWRDGSWIGVGAGAASSYGGQRWKNTPVLERYISSMAHAGRASRVEEEKPDLLSSLFDCLSLGLRLREGISREGFAARFGVDLLEALGEEGASLLASGMLGLNGDRVTIAEDRQLLTNEILVRLEPELEAWVTAAV